MGLKREALEQEHSGKLACLPEDQHLKMTYSEREQELGECHILIEPIEPDVQFNMSELQLKEVRKVIHKARASSAPGPCSRSHKGYKNCTKLQLHLWKIRQVSGEGGRSKNSGEWLKGCGF